MVNDDSGFETVKFGPYEWRVLDRNETGTLLITMRGIEARWYHNKYVDVTWEECSLRSWLNGEFLNRFTDAERARILKTRLKNDPNPFSWESGGNDTEDQVFLLSLDESRQYFKYSNNCICMLEEEAINEEEGIKGGLCRWWLRTPGHHNDLAAYIDRNGGQSWGGWRVDFRLFAVRPAMWVNLESYERSENEKPV